MDFQEFSLTYVMAKVIPKKKMKYNENYQQIPYILPKF